MNLRKYINNIIIDLKKQQGILGIYIFPDLKQLPELLPLSNKKINVSLIIITDSNKNTFYKNTFYKNKYEKQIFFSVKEKYFNSIELSKMIFSGEKKIIKNILQKEIIFDKTEHLLLSLKKLCLIKSKQKKNSELQDLQIEIKQNIEQTIYYLNSYKNTNESIVKHYLYISYNLLLKYYCQKNNFLKNDILQIIEKKDKKLFRLLNEFLNFTKLKEKVSQFNKIQFYLFNYKKNKQINKKHNAIVEEKLIC